MTRRDLLSQTGRGFGLVALSGLLEAATTNLLAPKSPHAPAKAKSVIYLFMHGGVSHVDTFDPKPELTRRTGQPLSVELAKTINCFAVLGKVEFETPIRQSGWIALRIFPSSHTNPIFALVGGKPIRASRRSAEWCLAGVNQCWTQKAPKIAPAERERARKAYDHAREVYTRLIAESGSN